MFFSTCGPPPPGDAAGVVGREQLGGPGDADGPDGRVVLQAFLRERELLQLQQRDVVLVRRRHVAAGREGVLASCVTDL